MAEKDFFAHATAVIDEPANIGAGTRIWHFSHVMAGAKVGRDCTLGQGVFVGAKAVIGDNVKVQNNVSIYDNVIIGDDAFLGPSCVFTNVINPRAFVERKDEYLTTNVGRGVSVGANATIVCGASLGEFCFIGAGAVVTKDVLPFAVQFGNPARQKGWVSRAGIILGDNLTCPLTNDVYEEIDGRLILATSGSSDLPISEST